MDMAEPLNHFAAAIAAGRDERFLIPPGRYLCSREIVARSNTMADVQIEAHGAEIVITTPVPEKSRHFFWIAHTAQRGGTLLVNGLSMRHNRPVGRVGNTDMMLFSGFQVYRLGDLAVLSSDNMGITIGRGDPAGFSPELVVMTNPRVGGSRRGHAARVRIDRRQRHLDRECAAALRDLVTGGGQYR